MRKMIIAIVILAVILTAGILESIYVEHTFEELDGKLTETLQYVSDDDASGALDSLNDLTAWWEQKHKILELFTYSADIRLLTVSLGETKGSLESGDLKNAMSKIESILLISENLREILNFNAQDII